MVALTAAAYREAMQNTNVGEQGKSRRNRGRSTNTPPTIMAKPLSEVHLKEMCGSSGQSSPQRTLTPQSSCADLETASSGTSSQRDFVEPAPQLQRESQTMPAWLRQNAPAANSRKAATGGARPGSIRDSLRARGQESMMAVLGGDADKITRSDLQARGDAVLESVRRGPGAGSSEAALGHLTVATIAPGARSALRMGGWSGCNTAAPQLWQQSPRPLSPPGMWWPGYPDSARAFDMDGSIQGGGLDQDSVGAFSCWEEQPMKVDLDSLASARISLAPPPGL